MLSEQRIRAILFYLSVLIFFIGLPFILSFALGYKFDPRSLKFTKTGIIVLKTQPQGASVYLNGKLLNEKTPLTVNELLPGTYNIKIDLEDYYSWLADIDVERGKVARFEKIMLFPLRANVKQLNKERLSTFWADTDEKVIYYINQDDSAIYTSDFEGERYRRLANLMPIAPPAIKFKLSENKEKLLYFNKHQVAISGLGNHLKEKTPEETPFILNYPEDAIIEAFWHSDNYHLIIVTNRRIEVVEARPQAEPVEIAVLNKKNPSIFYDTNTDTLYFTDFQKAADGNFYNNLYKLEINSKSSILRDIIKIKPAEQRQLQDKD